MFRKNLVFGIILALAGSVLLLAAACGDDDDEGGDDTSPTAAATASNDGDNGGGEPNDSDTTPTQNAAETENGDGATPTASAIDLEPDDPAALCANIAEEDVEEVIQTEISRTDFSRRDNGVECQFFVEYTEEEKENGGPVVVRFYTENGPREITDIRETYDTEDVDGIGDEAFYAPGRFSFYVRTGDLVFSLIDAVLERAWDPPDGWQEDLALVVLDSLP